MSSLAAVRLLARSWFMALLGWCNTFTRYIFPARIVVDNFATRANFAPTCDAAREHSPAPRHCIIRRRVADLAAFAQPEPEPESSGNGGDYQPELAGHCGAVMVRPDEETG